MHWWKYCTTPCGGVSFEIESKVKILSVKQRRICWQFLSTELKAYGRLKSPSHELWHCVKLIDLLPDLRNRKSMGGTALKPFTIRKVFQLKIYTSQLPISFILWLRHKLFAALYAMIYCELMVVFNSKSLFYKLQFIPFIVSLWQGQGWTNYNYTEAYG